MRVQRKNITIDIRQLLVSYNFFFWKPNHQNITVKCIAWRQIICLQFTFSTWWYFFFEHIKVLMKQAKTRINAQRWFIRAEQTLIPWFSMLLVLGTVFACSGSIFLYFCWWYSKEVMKRSLWLQMVVWRRKTNQVC